MEFYDVGSGDLRELWESYLAESTIGPDVTSLGRDEDWGSGVCPREKTSATPGVVLRDRLMTDAALGGPRPIKSEHSYSLLASSAPPSPATPAEDQNPDIPSESLPVGKNGGGSTTVNGTLRAGHRVLVLRSRMDDMEEECFPAISLDRVSGRDGNGDSDSRSESPSLSGGSYHPESGGEVVTIVSSDTTSVVKEEPRSPQPSSSPSSHHEGASNSETITIEPHQLGIGGQYSFSYTSDSDDEEAEYHESMELELTNCSTQVLTSNLSLVSGSEAMDNGGPRQSLPPTPPSSASSDSEGAASASCSSPDRGRRDSDNLRGLLTPRFYGAMRGSHGHVTRQPIHTPLISCQPKGSTGVLSLTEEEKRTLIAEGYPVPTKLPLTKQEEKFLKKVRRKIKNKISAQESRRKKKEYMDGLERRVTLLAQENSSYKDRLTSLEGSNRELVRELQRLQALLRTSA